MLRNWYSVITATTGTGREGIDERMFRLGLRVTFYNQQSRITMQPTWVCERNRAPSPVFDSLNPNLPSVCAIVRKMANPKHVAALRDDVDQWNQTRSENSTLRPDLPAPICTE